MADRNALDAALDTLDEVTKDWTAAIERAKRLEIALKNCLYLAHRRIRKGSDANDFAEWRHIIRFCNEGGIELSPLRDAVGKPEVQK